MIDRIAADAEDAIEWDDEEALFGDDEPAESGVVPIPGALPWDVLVIDDEPAVHAVTRLALTGVGVDGHPVRLFHADSSITGRALAAAHPDAALLLLDVVMDAEDAGLQLVRHIREDLSNTAVRIVLRTGQPGVAPEAEVMDRYDINDYLSKTDVTAQRLRTSVIGGIRSYRDLQIIERHRRGLSRVVGASSTLYEPRSVEEFVAGLLDQVATILHPRESAVFLVTEEGEGPWDAARIVAATGRYRDAVGSPVSEVVPPDTWSRIQECLQTGKPLIHGPEFCYVLESGQGLRSLLYTDSPRALDAWESQIVELFCANAAIALRNQRLHHERQELLEAFGRFVPDRMLQLLGKGDVRKVGMADQVSREMTVLFADVVGFSALAECRAPDRAVALLNRIFGRLVPIVEQAGGVVDKFLGDGLMALFPDRPAVAVEAGVELLRAVGELSAEMADELGSPLGMGVGIEAGPLILGTIGHQARLDTTVISDSVNVASRLERLTRTCGTGLLTTREVAEGLGEALRGWSRRLGTVRVRGRSRPVSLVEVFANDEPELRDAKRRLREAFEGAVDALEAGSYDAAAGSLEVIVGAVPADRPARMLLARCREAAAE